MSQKDKLLLKILFSTNDNNIKFTELLKIMELLGFEMRVKGSHHIFKKAGISYRPNLQKDGSLAKAYQVKQIRKLIIDNKLWNGNEQV